MEVDETMTTGHLDHARFSGERFGRILNHLSCSHSVFRTARALEVSRRMLWWGESRNATSQGVWDAVFQEISPLLSPVVPFLAQKTIACFSVPQEPWLLGRKMEPVRAAFFQKRSIMGALRGSNPEKLTLVLFLVPTRFLFHARFRFERRNPRLERRCLDPFVTGVPP